MKTTSLRWYGAIGALALVIAAGGCSKKTESAVATDQSTTSTAAPSTTVKDGGRSDGAEATESLGRITPAASAQYLSQAADKTVEAGTGRFTMAFRMSGMPGTTGVVDYMTMTGAFDTAAKRSKATMDLTGMAAMMGDLGGIGRGGPTGSNDDLGLGELFSGMFDEPVELVSDDTTAYMKWKFLSQMSGASTPWVSFDAGKANGSSSPTGFGADAGASFIEFLKGAGADVQEIGVETVDGVATTHYRAVLDLKDLAGKVDPANRDKVRQNIEQMGTMTMPVDVWIGNDDNHVRRMTMTMDLSELKSGSAGGLGGVGVGDVSMEIVIDFTGYGEPVDIELPPADQVTAVDPTAAMGGIGGSGSGRAGGPRRGR